MPDIRIHDRRHSYTSGALALGQSLRMAAAVGHLQKPPHPHADV